MNDKKAVLALFVVTVLLSTLLFLQTVYTVSAITVNNVATYTITSLPISTSVSFVHPWFKMTIAIGIVILMFRTQIMEWELLLMDRAYDSARLS